MDNPRWSYRRPGIAWAAASALMSAAFVVPWKLASEGQDEATAVFVLLLSAAVLNTAALPLFPGGGERWGATSIRLAVVLALLTFAGNAASAAAIARISAPLLSVLQRSEVLVVALVAWIFLGERPRRLFWIGCAIAGAGLWWMHGGQADLDFEGVGFGLLSSIAFGAMLVAVRHAAASIDTAFVNALRLWLSIGIWFLVHQRVPDLLAADGTILFYGSLTGLFGPFLGRLFSMNSSRTLEARFTALLLLAAPALTLPLAWFFLGTIPSSAELEGAGLMLAGVSLPVLDAARQGRQSPAARIGPRS